MKTLQEQKNKAKEKPNPSWINSFWAALVLINLLLFSFLAQYFSPHIDHSVRQKQQSALIGMDYMTMNNEFYEIMSEEIYGAIEEHGDRLIKRDPALSLPRQIEQIEQMLDFGIDALIVTPVDWNGIVPVLKQAKEQGVYVLVVDSGISDPEIADTTITSNNYEAGRMMGEYVLKDQPRGNFVLLTHEKAKSGQDRIAGFKEAVSKEEQIEIVQELECEGQTELAMPALSAYLDTNQKIDGIFCLNDLAAVGAVAALEQKGLLDQVKVYGVDASPDSKALIYEKMMRATIAQFPNQIGKITAQSLYRLLEGKEVSSMIQVPVALIDQENIEDYEIDRWQ